MLKLDHFASLFRAANKEQIVIPDVSIERILLVTDMDKEKSLQLWERWKGFFHESVKMSLLDAPISQSLPSLIEAMQGADCDLVVTYRCLHSDAWQYPYAIGSYVEVLTQIMPFPVLLMPHPIQFTNVYTEPKRLLLFSAELTKEAELLGFATAFASSKDVSLLMAQMDDQATYDRIFDIISKIPQIDTDDAQHYIKERRSNEMNDWVLRCTEHLEAKEIGLQLSHIDILEPNMNKCASLIEEHHADLLIINTKDEEQLAIHGLAYPIMVQFRNIPLLLR